MSTAKAPTKKQVAQTLKNEAAARKTQDLTIDKALSSLATTNLTVSKTIGSLQEEMLVKMADLDAVKQSIVIAQDELAQVHGKDQILLSIDELNQKYEQDRARLQEEMEATRKRWAQERADEAEASKRENEQYEYNLQQKRQQDEHTWQEAVRQKMLIERERSEKVEKDLTARNAEMASREAEFASYKAKADTFDATVKANVDREVAIVTNAMKRDHNHQLQMIEVKHAAETSVLNTKIEALQNKIADQSTTITAVEKQLQETIASNATIAKEALQSASGQRALAEIAQITGRDNGASTRGPRS